MLVDLHFFLGVLEMEGRLISISEASWWTSRTCSICGILRRRRMCGMAARLQHNFDDDDDENLAWSRERSVLLC